jgi:MSHA pilin protein MshD
MALSAHTIETSTRSRGLSLVELLVFVVVVGGALTALVGVFFESTRASADPMLRRQALAIAESLLEEVQLMPFTFCDGDDANVATAAGTAGCAGTADAVGPEAGETRLASPPFDHANDYHGYATTGIVDLTNAAVAGLEAYSAQVAVAPSALGSIGAGSGDALRITVTVNGPGGTQVVLVGYRARYAPNASF